MPPRRRQLPAPRRPNACARTVDGDGPGCVCVMVQLRETEIDELIRRKLLEADARNDSYAIRDALHTHFDHTLRTAK